MAIDTVRHNQHHHPRRRRYWQAADAFLQIRIWSRPDVFDQTEYALQLASSAYQFYTDYFETPEVVPKAGTRFTVLFSCEYLLGFLCCAALLLAIFLFFLHSVPA